jgi:hypothetical protein
MMALLGTATGTVMLIALAMTVLAGIGHSQPDEGVVQSVTRARCQSGIIACWDKITVVSKDGSSTDLFALSMTGLENRPSVGQTCRAPNQSLRLKEERHDLPQESEPWLTFDGSGCGTPRGSALNFR